jgi:hypothetical protein
VAHKQQHAQVNQFIRTTMSDTDKTAQTAQTVKTSHTAQSANHALLDDESLSDDSFNNPNSPWDKNDDRELIANIRDLDHRQPAGSKSKVNNTTKDSSLVNKSKPKVATATKGNQHSSGENGDNDDDDKYESDSDFSDLTDYDEPRPSYSQPKNPQRTSSNNGALSARGNSDRNKSHPLSQQQQLSHKPVAGGKVGAVFPEMKAKSPRKSGGRLMPVLGDDIHAHNGQGGQLSNGKSGSNSNNNSPDEKSQRKKKKASNF